MTEGISLIAAERARQLTVEKWTPDHDDEHDKDQLALAAACYCIPVCTRGEIADNEHTRNLYTLFQRLWPWNIKWWKPSRGIRHGDAIANEVSEITARIRDLEKAGALVAAEIDRLCRIRVGTILERTMDPGGRR